DSLAHRRLLVSPSCTPRTRTNPRHSSFTSPALVLPTGTTGTLPRTPSAPLRSPTPRAPPGALCLYTV
ncbi:hypothetical protein C0993_006958, partial [Termitomyces sp. T159_Od127]